jgi:hypothetical protein
MLRTLGLPLPCRTQRTCSHRAGRPSVVQPTVHVCQPNDGDHKKPISDGSRRCGKENREARVRTHSAGDSTLEASASKAPGPRRNTTEAAAVHRPALCSVIRQFMPSSNLESAMRICDATKNGGTHTRDGHPRPVRYSCIGRQSMPSEQTCVRCLMTPAQVWVLNSTLVAGIMGNIRKVSRRKS